jgi:hypothetical protein
MHRHEMQQPKLFICINNFLEFYFLVKIRVLQSTKKSGLGTAVAVVSRPRPAVAMARCRGRQQQWHGVRGGSDDGTTSMMWQWHRRWQRWCGTEGGSGSNCAAPREAAATSRKVMV